MDAPKPGGAEDFWVDEYIHVAGCWHTPTPRGKKPPCLGPFRTSAYVPLHLAAHLYVFLYPL